MEISIFIKDLTRFNVTLVTFGKIIVVNKFIPSIVWWVNVYHLDCSKIVLPEDFQHIKIIALDVEIFSVPKIFGSIEVGTQSFVGFLIGETGCSSFIRPSELITFFCPVEQVLRQLIAELVEVYGMFRLTVFI